MFARRQFFELKSVLTPDFPEQAVDKFQKFAAGTVIIVQRETLAQRPGFHRGLFFKKGFQVCVAEPVNGLFGVAHHEKIVGPRETVYPARLEPVGVLKFVDHDVLELFAVALAHRGADFILAAEKLMGLDQQIIKIQKAAFFLEGRVTR